MKYHDNPLSFDLNSNYQLIGGSYTVEDFSITSGQDPDGHIYKGLIVNFTSNGQITFSIGRNGSDDTANWFNSQITAKQNTFGHTAGSLNFALIGTLKITLTGGILGSFQETFTFSNAALAQGSDGGNNWWFGGKNCNYIQNNKVTGVGAFPDSRAVTFEFQRGGNSDSAVAVDPTTFIDTANWMHLIDDATQLDQIILPGSHDAGMSSLSHCAPPLVSEPYTQTQSGDIGQQLTYGSRYFDIRVDYDHDQLVTYHRSGIWGCNGQDLESIFDQTSSFLAQNPSETIVFKFSHIRDDDGHDPATIKQQLNTFLNGYSAIMYTNSDPNINLAQLNIGALRGKAIMVFDYADYVDPATGRFRYMDGDTTQPSANITVFDEYSNTADYTTMEQDQLQKWQEHAALGSGHFFLLSWTLTSTSPPITSPISKLAEEANSNLLGVLYSQIVSNQAKKPNIVYLDFISNDLLQGVLLYNF